jgi:hypothetical protein
MSVAALTACGQTKRVQPDRPQPTTHYAVPADKTPCRALRTRAASHRLARKLVDRVVAPVHQPERQTIGVIGESLFATCKQPKLPGVPDVAKYRPVLPVLKAVQRDFDEEAINGG